MTKAEKTRQFIIEKAAPIVNRKGMAATSISDIMEATKLAKGGIYGNFTNKDELCLEAFDFLAGKLTDRIDNAIAQKVTPKDKLLALLEFHNQLATADTGGCPLLNFGVEADDTSSVVNEKVAEAIKASQARIKNLVNQGIGSGDFKASVNAESFAVKMFTMLEGAILTSRVLKSNHQMNLVTTMLKAEIETFSS